MNSISLPLLLILLICSQLLDAQVKSPLLPSWAESEKKLEPLIGPPDKLDSFLKVPELNEIYATKNPELYWEMITQDQYPLIRLAGFEFLNARHDQSALDAAAVLCLSPKLPFGLQDYLLIYASDAQHRRQLIAGLDKYACLLPQSPERWSILIDALPVAELKKWYNSNQRGQLNITYSAIVWERIYADSKISANTARDLGSFCIAPGIPRAIFVLYGPEKSNNFKDAIASVLEDPNVPDTVKITVVLRKRTYILNNLQWKQLKLSNKVRNALQNK